MKYESYSRQSKKIILYEQENYMKMKFLKELYIVRIIQNNSNEGKIL